jgi:hypothetical protein
MLAARGVDSAKHALREPEVPVVLRYLVQWWADVSEGRSAGGMGMPSLSWTDLAAWSQVAGVRLSMGEAHALLRMDREFLRAAMPPEPSR